VGKGFHALKKINLKKERYVLWADVKDLFINDVSFFGLFWGGLAWVCPRLHFNL